MRRFVTIAVRRRVTVVMVAIAMAAFGIVGYQRLPLDLLPDINYPSLTIQTEFPGTAPAEVENLITRPVEEAAGVLRGLRLIHSVSRPGISEVTLQFAWGADMDMLLLDVREKLDRLILPEEASSPVVLRFDPALDPILRLSVSCPDDLMTGRQLADLKLKPALETIPGVASARIRGGLEEEVEIEVDQERMAALGIPLSRVRDAVGASNVNLPGGLLRGADTQYLIRTMNEYSDLGEIRNLIITHVKGASVRLGDIAEIRRGARDREEITRVGGKEVIEIEVFKEGDANIVATARSVREELGQLERMLPPGSRLRILFDQSRFIEQALSGVRSAALFGGILAIIVLMLFLRSMRATLIIATAIPLSLLFAFMAMYRMGISLNIMSLGGLTLGIGMLVDNAIVVLEAIHRKREEGLDLFHAAIDGSSEVAGAVTASTLTTVAVFLPIIFVQGIAGQFFGDMAWTVSLSLTASLVVAISLIPMLASIGGRGKFGTETPSKTSAGRTPFVGPLGGLYEQLLRGVLGKPRWTIAAALAALALTVIAARSLDTELIPDISEGHFYFQARLPEGTTVPATDEVLQEMAAPLKGDHRVSLSFTTAGSRMVSGGISMNTKAEHYGQLDIILSDRDSREIESAVADRLRSQFRKIPDLVATFGKPTYFSLKTPIEILLFGDDLAALDRYGRHLESAFDRVPGMVDLQSSLEEGNPEIEIIFDRDRLAALGLDIGQAAETLRNRIQGAVPTRFREADRQIDIRIRNTEGQRDSFSDIRNLIIEGPNGQALRLLSVADIREARGPAEIHRIGQQRAAVLAASLSGRTLGAVVGDIRRILAENPPPGGLSAELGGQIEEMQRSFASLRFALFLAVFLVYLVMAATFESFIHPLIVLSSVPLAAVGVVVGLKLTHTPVSIIVFIGVVMLAGIVVNNAIVLIDTINQLRRRKVGKKEAVIMAAGLRLRPIMMTTMTTVLGLLPMALSVGEGSELRSPLAVTVSFGLVFATLLTLVIIPSLYLLVPSKVTQPNEDQATGESG